MKRLNTCLAVLAVAVLALSLSAQAAFDRALDPVIVYGSECGDFLNIPIANVKVYAFDAATTTWYPIPSQVDEFKEKSDVPGKKEVDWNGDGKLTAFDEIVFMAKDMRDQAPDLTSWPNDAASKTSRRYEITSTDPSTGEKGYAYIFSSATLPASVVTYVSYKNDRVYGETYGIAHHSEVANGFADSLAVVGNNVDILENVRVRAKIKKLVVNAEYQGSVLPFTGTNIHFWEKMKDHNISLSYSIISLTVKATAFHDVASLKAKIGPVRVIRQHTLGIRFVNSVVALDDTSRIPITTLYYNNFSELEPSFSLTIGDDVKELEVEYISFSQAFNSTSMNVKFYGNGFLNAGSNDSLINKTPPNVIFKKDLSASDWPGRHWFGFSGQPTSQINNASFFNLIILAGQRIAPKTAPALFYFDFKDSFPDNSIPVYGDAGLQVYDWKKTTAEPTFAIDARFRGYTFAKNSTRSEFQQLFEKYNQPIQIVSSGQTHLPPPDVTPPGKITDLRITDRTDTTMTITWTAPGDDGYEGGPASYYVIRYSTVAPVDPPGSTDWKWWDNAAAVLNAPTPAEPGTAQSVMVTGLNEATIYYFRINVVDDAKNVSGLSNTAGGTTTPVELAAFIATVLPSRQVLLQWVTESETNNLGFQVQRRQVDRQSWEQLGFVPGYGTTTERHEYSYTDAPEPGQWFYRLKQTDADGAYEFSGEVSVSLSAPKSFALAQNYPNPFNPTTTIAFEIPADLEGRMSLIVYDMLGRQVRTLVDAEAAAGYYSLAWDGNDDTGRMTGTGVYIYQLRAGDLSETKKMIKVQ